MHWPAAKAAGYFFYSDEHAARGRQPEVRMEAWIRATIVRADTPVTMKWMGERLGMGLQGHLTHLLY
jgi:hypothetical protein